MKCQNIENVSFGAKLTTDPYKRGQALKKYLEAGISEFEKQTKNKPGCMTLRELDSLDKSPEGVFYFWNSCKPPRDYNGHISSDYTQIAFTTRDFLKHLIVDKNPKEQADIFENIFDALQVIPKKLKKDEKNNRQFMSNLSAQISEKLGKNKELLAPMFKHITDNPLTKPKLEIDDIEI